MQVFLSHAAKDAALARKLSARLTEAGLNVWDPDTEIVPGDNWATQIGRALDQTDLMVILLTPGARESDLLIRNLEYAVMGQRFANRVVTLFVGPRRREGIDVPWILRRLPFKQIDSESLLDEAVEDILARVSSEPPVTR